MMGAYLLLIGAGVAFCVSVGGLVYFYRAERKWREHCEECEAER